MLCIAAATLALGLAGNRQASHVLPLYDLVTSFNTSNLLTANFMLNSSNGSTSNIKVFYTIGDTSHFRPDGNWYDITTYCTIGISGTEGTITCQFASAAQGTLWVQYNGGPNDSPNGAESSFVAAEYGVNNQAGHSGRPGSMVPIVDRTPAGQNPNVAITFDLSTPYGGTWGNSIPQFYMNTGQGATARPGGGWQTMAYQNLTPTGGSQVVTVTGQPNANAGLYIVAIQQTYVPSESYNIHNSQWTEYSGVIRSYSG